MKLTILALFTWKILDNYVEEILSLFFCSISESVACYVRLRIYRTNNASCTRIVAAAIKRETKGRRHPPGYIPGALWPAKPRPRMNHPLGLLAIHSLYLRPLSPPLFIFHLRIHYSWCFLTRTLLSLVLQILSRPCILSLSVSFCHSLSFDYQG